MAEGVAVAARQYAGARVPTSAPEPVSALTTAARRDLYGDTVNEAVFMRPGDALTRTLATVDDRAVDGAVVGTAAGVAALSTRVRKLQNGFVRTYATYMFLGAAESTINIDDRFVRAENGKGGCFRLAKAASAAA